MNLTLWLILQSFHFSPYFEFSGNLERLTN
jgi:hypothetical protein